MRLVRKFRIPYNEQLDKLCKASKDLYNQALYIQRQKFINENEYIGYYELDKMMKTMVNADGEVNYRKLKAQVAQQTLMLLDKNWKSFFRSIKEWKNNPSKFTGRPNLPKYKPKDGRFLLIYPNQSCQIRNRRIILDRKKNLYLDIPDGVWIDELENFQQVRILPKNRYFEVEIVYEKECENAGLDYDQYAAIDLGLDNLVTLVNTLGHKPLIINGKIIKSFNQWYNKEVARLQSVKDKMKIKKYTKRMYQLKEVRNDRINDQMHKISRLVVNYLLENKIGNLVIGYNKNWKQKCNMGSRNNQNFVQIPYERLIRMLEYKCQLIGIKVILVEEAYTSKCDALALERIGKNNEYLGKRISRGLYQSSTGKLINADVNAALNILRKVVHDSFFKRIVDRGLWSNPVKVRSLFEETDPLRTILLKVANAH